MAYSNWYDWNMTPSAPNNDDAHLNLRELSKYPLPLGLKLTLTPEMLPYTEQNTNAVTETSCLHETKKVEKLKAVHFPICMLMIGFFKVLTSMYITFVILLYSKKIFLLCYIMCMQIEAKYPADLVAKFYYAKRKLVWEIMRDGLKDKIEIQWRNISAIRAIIEDNSPGILEIEVLILFHYRYKHLREFTITVYEMLTFTA